MKPVANWRAVLRRAWSVRLIAAAVALSSLEVALPLIDGLVPIPPGVFLALSVFANVGAFVARHIAQKDIENG